MGFLDTIKERLRGVSGDEYYEDDYYDEDYEEDGYSRGSSRRREAGSSSRLLGTTPRPEAESVSVYTRSGRPVSVERTQQTAPISPRPYAGDDAYDDAPSHVPTPGDLGPRTISRVTSGQLPPYVLKPVSYDDVQTVVRRVRTGQPVVIVFRNTNTETAKRILDFCFGFSYGVGGEIEELGDRVFAVLPGGVSLSQTDIDKLVADGDLER